MAFNPDLHHMAAPTQEAQRQKTQLFQALQQIFFQDTEKAHQDGLELLLHTPITVQGTEYKVLRKVGQGAFGVVVAVEPVDMPGQKLALKLSRPFDRTMQHQDSQAGEFTRGFMRETAALKKINELQDPSAYPKYYGAQFIAAPGFPDARISALLSELVEGEGLDQTLEHNKLLSDSPKVTLDLAQQFAEAVDLTHRAGFVHRDIKPNNALLDWTGRLRLVDLGVVAYQKTKPAKRVVYQDSVIGAEVGTPAYTADDELAAVGPERDVYALGRVFEQFLFGNGLGLLDGGRAKHQALEDIHNPVMQKFANLAKRMTSREPANRPTMPEVLEQITALVQFAA